MNLNESDVEFSFPEPKTGMRAVDVGTGIIVRHIPTGIVVEQDTERSQFENREKAPITLQQLLWRKSLVAVAILAICLSSCTSWVPKPVLKGGGVALRWPLAAPAAETCVAIDSDKLDEPAPFEALRIWGRPSKFWSKQDFPLKVRFLGGSSGQQAQCWRRFQVIDALCGASFVMSESGPSDIRVDFRSGGGHWSYLGRDCRDIPQTAQTMNIGLGKWDAEDEWDRVALHEILHALGIDHEQSHREANIQWKEDTVIDHYARSQGWTAAQTRRQVLDRYTGTDFSGTRYDPESIMQYPIPKELTKNGFSVGWNRKLTCLDKRFLTTTYPP